MLFSMSGCSGAPSSVPTPTVSSSTAPQGKASVSEEPVTIKFWYSANESDPVSYTHLDVYKRQVQKSLIRAGDDTLAAVQQVDLSRGIFFVGKNPVNCALPVTDNQQANWLKGARTINSSDGQHRRSLAWQVQPAQTAAPRFGACFYILIFFRKGIRSIRCV